jgi:DNA-binding transcriptional MerR regulator
MPEGGYDIKTLCSEVGVTPRTVHYYIQLGLLPGAGTVGPGARYSSGHLARLRLIRLLQQEHLPLGEIRQRLEALVDPQIETLLKEQSARSESPPSSAVDYIRELLRADPVEGTVAAARPQFRQTIRSRTAKLPAAERSQWERIVLSADVELHVRRPSSRGQNRRVDRLIEQARDIFKEDSYDS